MTKIFSPLHDSEKGVVDLTSIMVGVVVSSILAGAVSVALLGIIPNMRDDTAKQQLNGIRIAQEAYQSVNGKYGDSTALAAADLLVFNPTNGIKVVQPADATQISCYIAYVVSETGKTFYVGSNIVDGEGRTTRKEQLLGAGVLVDTLTCTPSAATATQTPFFSNISLANSSVLNIAGNGKLYGWGNNTVGQLGQGNTSPVTGPVEVPAPVTAALPWVKVSISDATANVHALAIDSKGQLWAWGANNSGQLGDGTTIMRTIPTLIKVPSPSQPTLDNSWLEVEAGGEFSVAIDATGKIYTWGLNTSGQLGIGTTGGSRSTPGIFTAESNRTWKKISAGTNNLTNDGYFLALDFSDKLYGAGDNSNSQLGVLSGSVPFSNTMRAIQPTTSFTQISAGPTHVIAIDTADKLWSWGSNDYGQAGVNPASQATISAPAQLTTTSGTFREIAAGLNFSVALGYDQKIYTWGSGVSMQQGNNVQADRFTPGALTLPAELKFVGIEASNTYGNAIDSNGFSYWWGKDSSGTKVFALDGTGEKAIPTLATPPTGFQK